ncbi:MAG: 16S rRNA (guanine(527)-N(7))-methyltransferase RsmG [Polyangiaceae bacterium]
METAKITAQARIFDVELEALAIEQISGWLELLKTWNRKLDLTAAKREPDLLDVMLSDAFVLSKHLPKGASVVDIGSGAGAPGLPLAIVRRDLKVTLVEPAIKRVSFLRTVLSAIGRTDIKLQRGRGEEIDAASVDVAISRATLPPMEWLTLGASLVRPGGEVWVLLAAEDLPISLETSHLETITYAWPNSGHQRRAARYSKV